MTERALKKQLARYQITYSLACYALDDNPQHLWTVWRWCRKYGIDTPRAVLEYLDRVAAALDPKSESQHERIADQVRAAVLGEVKAPKPRETIKHARIVQRALEMSRDLDLNEDQRNELAGLAGDVDERTIRRWLKRAKQIMRE